MRLLADYTCLLPSILFFKTFMESMLRVCPFSKSSCFPLAKLSLIDLLAVHPCLDYFDLLDCVRSNATWIFIEDHEIGKLTWFQAADFMFREKLPGSL